jgi:hypothetical protein
MAGREGSVTTHFVVLELKKIQICLNLGPADGPVIAFIIVYNSKRARTFSRAGWRR